jgi:hypothetical protein
VLLDLGGGERERERERETDRGLLISDRADARLLIRLSTNACSSSLTRCIVLVMDNSRCMQLGHGWREAGGRRKDS